MNPLIHARVGASMRPRILLIDGASRPQYYTELRDCYRAEWLDRLPSVALPKPAYHCDLAIVSDEFDSATSSTLCVLIRGQVPTLHVVDGIVEWRNTWENPRSLKQERGMPLFQPVLAGKIACLGRSQVRLLESWGNVGKCEVVGAPRFDRLRERRGMMPAGDGRFQVLVMTAKTAGFTPEQIARTKQSLLDVKAWFERHPSLHGRDVWPIWRITGGLEEELGIDPEMRSGITESLADTLRKVDAVITTPSTAMLESILQGVPVGLLDYNNCPHYVPAAWTISAQSHLDQVIPELMHPAASKMLYQDTILHDALECRTPALPRMVRLIDEMIRIGHECRARSELLRFPRRILQDEQDGHHLPEERFEFSKLFPNHPVFAEMDRVVLQAEIGHLRLELKRREEQLERQMQERAAARRILKIIEASPLLRHALRLRRTVRQMGRRVLGE